MPVVGGVEGLLEKLRELGEPTAFGFVLRGQRLLHRIDDWHVRPVDALTRAQAYSDVSAWMSEVLAYMIERGIPIGGR
jgi:hypothetical protein